MGEINEVVRGLAGPPEAERSRPPTLLEALAARRGRLRPGALRAVATPTGRLAATAPVDAGGARRRWTSARSPTWPTGPTRRSQLVPLTEVVHDRLNVEVFRGCTRGCRFCQAGHDHPAGPRAPGRARSARWCATGLELDRLRRGGAHLAVDRRLLRRSRTRCATSSTTRATAGRCRSACPACGSTPSPWARRPRSRQVRRTGLTFAPEGGTWRMRQVINKLITEEDLYGAVDAAFSQGWRRVKLYFLIGLPTERDEDVLGIAELAAALRRDRPALPPVGHRGGLGRGLRAQAPHAVPVVRPGHGGRAARARCACCATPAGRTRGLTIRWHDPEATVVEGLASRGDRRMGAVIERVWRAGGTFQEWSERFDLGLWEEALAAEGLALEEVVPPRPRRRRGPALGPHLGRPAPGLPLGATGRTPWPRPAVEDCRWTPCYDCGACTDVGLEHVVASAGPAGRRAARGPARTWRRGGPAVPVRLDHAVPSWTRSAAAGPSGACGSASPRRARSASPATATWPGCGSGPCAAAGLPVACSQGFSPRPLLSFGLALPDRVRVAGRVPRRAPWGRRRPGETPVAEPARGAERPAARGDRGPGGGPGRGCGRLAPAGGNIVCLGAGGARGDRTGVDGSESSGCSTPRVLTVSGSGRVVRWTTTSVRLGAPRRSAVDDRRWSSGSGRAGHPAAGRPPGRTA